jgi:transcription-repair coupling factor (superfamily II helicase)
MAARDLSVITTPPPNRYPIETNVVGFSEEVIRDAISYEIQNGQVFSSITALKTLRK